jgi:glycerophosphoryl diester phosphodiesterase
MASKNQSDPQAYLISSFRWDELEIIRALDADLPIAVLTEEDPLLALDMARKLQAKAINPYYKNVDASVVDALHQAGFQVFPWTVNEPEDLQAMKAAGVDGLFTNFPERLR